MGRLHHVTYATDQREDILRAADKHVMRAWSTAKSVWLIHVLVGVGVVCFSTWVMVNAVRPGHTFALCSLQLGLFVCAWSMF